MHNKGVVAWMRHFGLQYSVLLLSRLSNSLKNVKITVKLNRSDVFFCSLQRIFCNIALFTGVLFRKKLFVRWIRANSLPSEIVVCFSRQSEDLHCGNTGNL